jgi:hypothetical protein
MDELAISGIWSYSWLVSPNAAQTITIHGSEILGEIT